MTRHAYCHFCDDIRFEIGNKTSAMGIYSGEIYLPQIPLTLSKLCVIGFCSTPVDRPFKTLGFRVTAGDEVVQEQFMLPAELERIQQSLSSRSDANDPIKEIAMGMNVILSPFHALSEATVAMTMIADGEEMIAGKLRIRVIKEVTEVLADQSTTPPPA